MVKRTLFVLSISIVLPLTLLLLGMVRLTQAAHSSPQKLVSLISRLGPILISNDNCQVRIFDGISDGPIFSTVQAAVDASLAETDLIKVAGTCSEVTSRAGLTQTVYIDKSITIRGGYTVTNWNISNPMASPTTLQANQLGRVIYVTGADVNVTIENLRLMGGRASGVNGGGGVFASKATLTLSNTQIFGNTAEDEGGGIYGADGGNDPTFVKLINSQIFSNEAAEGGGVANSDTMMVIDSEVFSNTADRGGGGIHAKGEVILNDADIRYNEAGLNGGGIYVFGEVQMNGGQVFSNSAPSGGGVYLGTGIAKFTQTGGVIAYNQATNNIGGGIYVAAGDFTLNDGSIENNKALGGGGMYVSGEVTMQGGQVFSNSASGGGGIQIGFGAVTAEKSRIFGNTSGSTGGGVYLAVDESAFTLTGGAINNNSAKSGGGVSVSRGNASLNESEIAGNQANNTNGGGVIVSGGSATLMNTTISDNEAEGDGGGVHANGGVITLTNTTVSDNSATNGGGVFYKNGTLILKNTLIADNLTGGDCSGAITSKGHNLAGDASCATLTASGDLTATNPQLGPLQNNGGDTRTYALPPNSPAIDAGDNLACPATDQRGRSRPFGDGCDIGAFEFSGESDLPKIYLPFILKPEPLTQLFIRSINTGGIDPVEVRDPADGDKLLLSCIIGNNVTAFCGSFPPIGAYKLVAFTSKCGILQGMFNDATPGAIVTREVFCN